MNRKSADVIISTLKSVSSQPDVTSASRRNRKTLFDTGAKAPRTVYSSTEYDDPKSQKCILHFWLLGYSRPMAVHPGCRALFFPESSTASSERNSECRRPCVCVRQHSLRVFHVELSGFRREKSSTWKSRNKPLESQAFPASQPDKKRPSHTATGDNLQKGFISWKALPTPCPSRGRSRTCC